MLMMENRIIYKEKEAQKLFKLKKLEPRALLENTTL